MPKYDDSPSILENGTGTPFLWIANGTESFIMNPKNNLPIGELVTSFRYKYKEDGVDEGEITLHTDNFDLPADPQLQQQCPLCLQWGYIYPSLQRYLGPKRRVIIVAQDINWGPDGLDFTIKFAARGFMLKNIPAEWNAKEEEFDNFFSILRDIDNGKLLNRIFLVDALMGKRETQDVIIAKRKPLGPIQATSHTKASQGYLYGGGVNGLAQLQMPTESVPQEDVVTIFDNSNPDAYIDTTESYILDDEKDWIPELGTLVTNYVRTFIFTAIPPTKWGQLREAADHLKNGPYGISGRDDDVVVHNRNLNRPITRYYTYAGGNGELLSFKVNSEFAVNYTEVIKSSDVNPDTKSIDITIGQNMGDPNQREGNKGAESSNTVLETSPKGYWTMQDVAAGRVPGSQGLSSMKLYASTEDALQDLMANPSFTMEEYQALMDKIKQDVMTDPSDPLSMVQKLENMNDYLTYKITRKVLVRSYHSAARHSTGGTWSNVGAPNTGVTGQTQFHAQGAVNQFVNGYGRGMIIAGVTPSYQTHSTPSGGDYIAEEMIPSEAYFGNPDNYQLAINPGVVTAEIQEITFPMSATQIRQNMPNNFMTNHMFNDLQRSLDVSTKAKATVIGHPLLEDSMNFWIQGVSSKYTGIWYAIEVEHVFSINGGYTCNIEFVPREHTMSSSVIHARFNNQAMWEQDSEHAKKSGDKWRRPQQAFDAFKEEVESTTDSSSEMAVYDNESGNVDVYTKAPTAIDSQSPQDGNVQYMDNMDGVNPDNNVNPVDAANNSKNYQNLYYNYNEDSLSQ